MTSLRPLLRLAAPAAAIATAVIVALWSAPALAQEAAVTNALGMAFVRIEPGAFVVGRFQPECPAPPPEGARPEPGPDPRARWTEADYLRCAEMARRDARPGFRVAIERSFYLGRYEVTQAEWERVMGTNPSHFQGERVAGDAGRHPVDSVTWEEAQAFVARLNALDTTAVYRLPTEFEWEYAARAGNDGALPWAEIRAQGWISDVDRGTTHPVGEKAPNAWGLHDMLGNVWEWVADPYNGRFFPDPVPPASGDQHVLKGGSFLSDVKNATPATHAAGPGNGFDVGLRIVRE